MRPFLPFLLAVGLFSCTSSKHTHKNTISKDALSQLRNKHWLLQRLPDTTLPKMEKQLYIAFDNNGADLSGFGGCNGFGGIYSTDDKGLHLTNIVHTQMWCDYGPIENKFIKALEKADNFIINGDNMQLLQNDKPVAYFTAEYIK
jgi:heat shock protein HslJ